MRTRRLTTTAAVVLAAGAAASPAIAAQDLRMPDTRDVAAGRYPAPSAHPVVVRIESGSEDGLNWDSAAIGALAGVGLLVSASGSVLLVARRQARTH